MAGEAALYQVGGWAVSGVGQKVVADVMMSRTAAGLRSAATRGAPDVAAAYAGENYVLSSSVAMVEARANARIAVELIPPKNVLFSQVSVTGVAEIEASMRVHGWVGSPIDVVRMEGGRLVAIDNTRLLAAHRAGIDVKAVVREASEPLPKELIERFTKRRGRAPATWGDAVNNRIGSHGASYRTGHPHGSFATGSTE